VGRTTSVGAVKGRGSHSPNITEYADEAVILL
jgi:hypothetical protein